jgi:hypothetical protein
MTTLSYTITIKNPCAILETMMDSAAIKKEIEKILRVNGLTCDGVSVKECEP